MGKGGNSRLLSTRARFLKVNNHVSLILGKYTRFRRSTAYYVTIPRLDTDFNTCFTLEYSTENLYTICKEDFSYPTSSVFLVLHILARVIH